MKRIEFIAPVESMRGNLSGKQSLQYAKKNNPAWDAPDGTNYARNYRPSYVGQRRVNAVGDKKIFATKTKSAAVINNTTRLKMAVLAGSGVLFNKAMHDLSRLSQLQLGFEEYRLQHPTATMRQWLQPQLQQGLELKDVNIAIPLANVSIPNPWVADENESNVYDIDFSVLVKFWPQLATNPVIFTVKGLGTGVAHEGNTYAELSQSKYNNLSLSITAVGNVNYVTRDDTYFLYYMDGASKVYLTDEDAVVAEPLFLTSEAPA